MSRIALSTGIISSLKISPACFLEGSLLGLYTFKKYIGEKDNKALDAILVLSKVSKELKDALQWTKTIASSVCFARDLVNTPSNDMTPTHLANIALSLIRKNLSVKVLENTDVQKLGLG